MAVWMLWLALAGQASADVVEAGLCIERDSGSCGVYSGSQSYDYDVSHGQCDTDADCSVGSCVVATYCLKPAEETVDTDSDGAGAGDTSYTYAALVDRLSCDVAGCTVD